jgi:hypothetical protein
MAAFRKIVDCQTQFDWSFERGRNLHHIFCVVPRSVLAMSQMLMKKGTIKKGGGYITTLPQP